MDYEKKYKKALEHIKECVPDENGFITIYPQEIFPELAESEDEKIRKNLITCISTLKHPLFSERERKEFIVYLERHGKQKPYVSETMNEKGDFDSGFTRMMENEQKPVDKYEPMSLDEAIEHCKEKSCGNNACALEHKQLEKWLTELKELKERKNAWSGEDEKIYQSIMDDTVQENQLNDKQTNWLTDIKYRYFPQSEQEWSEEDEKMLKDTIRFCELCGNQISANWLKSFKDRHTWKPSDEQMRQLHKYCPDNMPLTELYEQLKKLKG